MAKGLDVEAGDGRLYPTQMENPDLRWGFIRKVYAILTLQMILTVGVACAVVFVRPIPRFLFGTTPGIGVYVIVLILPLILLLPLYLYMKRHPVNLFLLGLFTIAMAFAVGCSCALSKGRVVLEAGILTSVVVLSLTLFTFWAAKRGYDFSFLGPFLFASILVLIVFSLIQIFFPMGKLSMMIYGLLATLVFSGFIIYDTDNLIKRFSYDDYIPAAISLYLDIINLFLAMLEIFDASNT